MSNKKKMNSNPNNENNNDNNKQEKKISEEQMWDAVDKLLEEEQSKRRKLNIKQIGTFVDPKKEQEEREAKEHNNFYNFIDFLNKASTHLKIQEIHKHKEETTTSGRNWQSASNQHLLAKFMNLSQSKSKKFNNE